MDDEFQSAGEDSFEFDNENNAEEESDPEPLTIKPPAFATTKRKRNSFVWQYYRPVRCSTSHECIICNAWIGDQTSNLTRHLAVAHNIRRQPETDVEPEIRGRGRFSFIWKYCSKESEKYARCHLCHKLLYFGGGNTGNISKHLRRRHLSAISKIQIQQPLATMEEINETVTDIHDSESLNDGVGDGSAGAKGIVYRIKEEAPRRERKGGSYVWNYCDKLSRHTIRCRLCTKVMSFHGTANVITHLQRKHNIVGKIDSENNVYMEAPNLDLNFSEENSMADDGDAPDGKRLRRSSVTMSIVWKYCTRVGKDMVRCGFCKKNLSYQGTSNLQRHLHRMHGVATQGRSINSNDGGQYGTDGGGDHVHPQMSADMIWEYCSQTEDGEKIKCNMCNTLFDRNDIDEIIKHLTMLHSISPRRKSQRRRKSRRADSVDDTYDEEYDESENDNWTKEDDLDNDMEFDATNIKKDTTDSFYDDIIEEEHDQTNYDEDPFDPNITNEVPVTNPLSPQTSRGNSPDMQSIKLFSNTRQMQKLNEERVRMETEYFREKAGFYRMQKYLTALQAKKVRVELERLSHAELNAYDVDAADVSAAAIQQQLTTH